MLALGMLSALHRSLELLRPCGRPPEPDRYPPGSDPDTYAMLQRGDALGALRSRGLSSPCFPG